MAAKRDERDRDRALGEDRDGRRKRRSARDKREDAKEREDRGGQDREKELAWMDTYVLSETGPGVLGGKGDAGELDMEQLDAIQLFKLMMKREESKRTQTDSGTNKLPASTSAEGTFYSYQGFPQTNWSFFTP